MHAFLVPMSTSRLREFQWTVATLEMFFHLMQKQMLIQQFLFGKIVSANHTFEWALVGVFGAVVVSHIGRRSKCAITFAAFMWSNVVMRFHVGG